MFREATALACHAPKGQNGLDFVKVEEQHDVWRQDFTLRGNLQSQEVFRQQFRQFGYSDFTGPREALNQLQKLCQQWLRPEEHSKEQILELLVLEQFVAILPVELQAWVREHRPGTGEEAVTLLEELEREFDEPRQQDTAHGQEMICREMTLVGTPKFLSSPLQSLENCCRSESQEAQVFHERDEATLPFRVEDGELQELGCYESTLRSKPVHRMLIEGQKPEGLSLDFSSLLTEPYLLGSLEKHPFNILIS